ncbi:MAG: hypothetical protein A2W03_17240 [Candidatus Aminicenantes bacterium RBG_16_63_16]|nr:MAG: hypothetical protein A2W03_17240 [Candidatus Aminicenantes bacterium RBG_16_63_16]
MKVTTDYGRMELRFVLNDGQLDKGVAYYVQGKDKSVYFRPDGLTFVLNQSARPERRGPDRPGQGHRVPAATSQSKSWSVGLDFVGAREDLRPEGRDLTDGIVSYFKGRPEDWKTGLPTYARLAYPEVWPGIDLAYSGTVSRLKYEFVVKPGADPGKIRLAYRGASEVRADEAGGLEVVTPLGSFHDGAPVAYQEVNGKRVPVSVAYELSESVQGRRGNPEDSGSVTYGFSLGEYDRTWPLILDPVVFVYCGFIGGDSDTEARDIVVDTSGNAFITGYTWASTGTFPVTVGPDLTYSSSYDAFVAKLNSSGTAYLYCGYLGGTSGDSGEGIAIDASGNAYIAGYTDSSAATFPVLTGPDLVWNGLDDAFVAKVNAAGTALVYCGYIGGSGLDYGFDIGVDGSGNAYLAGMANSTQTTFPETVGPDLTHNGDYDAFVAKVNASGTALSYCGYIGGSSTDYGYGIAVGTTGNAYVGGYALSTQTTFPEVVGPDLTHNGSADAFVAKVTTAGAISYCGYLGGSDADWCEDIAIDSSENAYLTGSTYSSQATFPEAVGPDLTHNGGQDAFIAKVSSAGTAILYCGYLGGSSADVGYNIAADARGNVYLAGNTESDQATFPVLLGPDLTYNDNEDAFVAKVNAAGSALVYCGYLGGPAEDEGWGVAVDTAGSAYIVGYAESTEPDFPVYIGPDLTQNSGYRDGFVAKIVDEPLWKPHHAIGDFDGDGADEVAVDFGGTGAWTYDNGSWSQLTAVNPESLMAADVDGDALAEVIADLGFSGLWLWNGGAWNQLSAVNVDCAAAGDIDADFIDEVVGDFGAAGLWLYNNGSWTQLSGVNADYVAIADLNGAGGEEIIGDFASTGLWIWDTGAWTQLSGVNADYTAFGNTDGLVGQELIGDFAATGLWLYGGGLWTQLSGVNADYATTADTDNSGDDEIFGDFAATGLWLWDSGAWTQLSNINPDFMVAADTDGTGNDGLIGDFAALGMWLVKAGVWTQISGVNPDYLMAADVDSDGAEEVLGDFGALGMWKWDGGAWAQISPGNAE